MRRLGVLGTLVLDTIHRPAAEGGDSPMPLTDWGGIAYSLSTLESAAPEGWEVFPIVKVGADLRLEADRFFDGLERVVSWEGVVTDRAPNNRVDLYYRSGPRRCEKLTGGVPGWTWDELEPLAGSCDALIINFIAGWEVDLTTACRLRTEHPGMLYADIHSLLLAVGDEGVRVLKPLPEWPEWRRCFDIVQMNDEELAALAGDRRLEVETAQQAVRDGPRVLYVTRGTEGVSWFERGGEGADPTGPIEKGHASADVVAIELADPTGCGDVWGAACAAALLEGKGTAAAARRANRLAGAAARHRGTAGLADVLRGALSEDDAA
jgi:hypothetical protein